MFRTGIPSIIRSLALYTQLLARSGYSILISLADSQQKPVWQIPIAVYTALDSWWWTENLSEIFRILFQKYIEKLVHLFGFITRIRVLELVNMNKWLVSGSQSLFLVSTKFPSISIEPLTSGAARVRFNPLAMALDIYSLAHHLCKMWIFYEPRRVTLGNTRHFVEE